MRMSPEDTFRYLSVCSGIEAATVAWHPLGWEAAAYSEIEAFPRAVLQHHYPDTPLHADFTTIKGDEYGSINLICGGTPCQDYSIAGTREGLDGERGQLTLEFSELAYRCGSDWLVWENVPGCLSSNHGRDFGAVIASFAGYVPGTIFAPANGKWQNSGICPPAGPGKFGLAWRVLDLQYFGIPQRRNRVVLVGYLGDWRPAAAVLFEPESMQGNPAPRREEGARVAGTLEARAATGGYDPGAHGAASGHLVPDVAALTCGDRGLSVDQACAGMAIPEIAHTLRGEGFDASEDGTGRGTPIVPVGFGGGNTAGAIDVAACLTAKGQRLDFDLETFVADPVAFNCKQTEHSAGSVSPPLRAMGGKNGRDSGGGHVAVAVSIRGREEGSRIEVGGEQSHALRASQGGSDKPHMFDGHAVRRLTPVECERLMGFPDNYTRIPYRGKPADLCPDGPRYKSLGNSWGVPKFAWVGRRIQLMERILKGFFS